MERHKTLFLVFLVCLSLFLSYKLMFEVPSEDHFTVEIDSKEIIAYKRFYSVNPNRESLLNIPNKDINTLLVESLKNATPKRVGDKLISSDLKDEGYLVISAFDLPINLVFTCFKEKMPKLPFESFDRMFFSNTGDILLNTENGVYKFDAKYILKVDEALFKKCVRMDDNFMPTKIVGVNAISEVENPVENYTISDRAQLANGFLKSEVAEIVEEGGYLFSTEEESLRIYSNGTIHYLRVSPNEETKTSLYDSLTVLRAFIKKSPVNFSNYRIVNMFENNENTLFYLTDASLPFYTSENLPIVVNINSGVVTSFSYNSKFLRDFESIYIEPEASFYRQAFKESRDPILVYSDEELNVDKRAVLKTIDTR